MTTALLIAQELVKEYGGVRAVDGVSISIAPHTINCIIGPNGAGKSTFFNMICGAVHCTSGKILYKGQDITKLPLHKFARIGISRKFQIPSVFPSLTVEENLQVAASTAEQHVASRIDILLEKFDFLEIRHNFAGELAHGQKQWLEIGMAMMIQPDLLLLDEPTAGMTTFETAKTAALLKELASDVTVIAIEHDMQFVRDLGCHTWVMHQGKLIKSGDIADLEGDPLIRDIYLGRH